MTASLREYAPVPLGEQVRELEAQIRIHQNSSAKWIGRHRMSEVYAAAQLQRLQSALRTLQTLERLLGAGTALSADDLFRRLAAPPTQGTAA